MATLIFDSIDVKEGELTNASVDTLHEVFLETLDRKEGDSLIVTTTYSPQRTSDYWSVDIDVKDSISFFYDLMYVYQGRLRIYQEENGMLYGAYQSTETQYFSIWKFHFEKDLDRLIENATSHSDSVSFEDVMDNLKYELMQNGYVNFEDDYSMSIYQNGYHSNYYVHIASMKTPILYGTIYYDPLGIIDDFEVIYDESFTDYIKEVLI